MTAAAAPEASLFRREALRGHLAMVLFAALVSGSFSLGARAAPHIDPSAMMAIRFALATAVALGVVIGSGLLRGQSLRASVAPIGALGRRPWRFAALGLSYGAYFVLMFEALRLAAPAPLGAVFTLTPLMTAGFAFLILGQRVPASVLAALLIGAAGAVWVVFRGDLDALMRLEIGRGEAIFFVGAVCHAIYTPLSRKLTLGEPIPVFILGVLIGAGLLIAAVGARTILATDWTGLPPIVWLVVVYLAVATTAATASLIQFAAARLPAAKVMAYTYLVPSFVILYEGLVGAGWAPAAVWPGVAATLLALLLLLREGARQPAPG